MSSVCGYFQDNVQLATIVSVFSIFPTFQASAHLPYEFTVTGMLERLNAYVEYQVCIVDFHFKVFKKSLNFFFSMFMFHILQEIT